MNNVNNTSGVRQARTRSKPKRKPSTLPTMRTGLSNKLIWVAALISITVSLAARKDDKFVTDAFFLLIGLPFSLLFLVEVIFRVLYAIEEHQHLFTRYENSYLILIKDVFNFSSSSWMLSVCFVFFNMTQYGRSTITLWYEMGPTSMLTSLLAAFFLRQITKLESGPLYNSFWIQNSNGLDYGSGMAHSFFHGYLKLVIPKTGDSEKHLEELMKDYEAKHGVKLQCYKLFILIPKSLYCPTSLMDEGMSPTIEESSSLDPKIKTVAGVQNRVYKNSIYKIKLESGKRIYICAEYATPLKTFKDVVSHNGEHSNHYKKYKNEIVLQFYLTLKKVLKEHPDCTNYCEPIFYDDIDENGDYKDVGLVLLNSIKKVERRTKELREKQQ